MAHSFRGFSQWSAAPRQNWRGRGLDEDGCSHGGGQEAERGKVGGRNRNTTFQGTPQGPTASSGASLKRRLLGDILDLNHSKLHLAKLYIYNLCSFFLAQS